MPDEDLLAKANLYHHDPRDTNLKIRLLMATGNSEDSHGTPNAALRKSLVSQQTQVSALWANRYRRPNVAMERHLVLFKSTIFVSNWWSRGNVSGIAMHSHPNTTNVTTEPSPRAWLLADATLTITSLIVHHCVCNLLKKRRRMPEPAGWIDLRCYGHNPWNSKNYNNTPTSYYTCKCKRKSIQEIQKRLGNHKSNQQIGNRIRTHQVQSTVR